MTLLFASVDLLSSLYLVFATLSKDVVDFSSTLWGSLSIAVLSLPMWANAISQNHRVTVSPCCLGICCMLLWQWSMKPSQQALLSPRVNKYAEMLELNVLSEWENWGGDCESKKTRKKTSFWVNKKKLGNKKKKRRPSYVSGSKAVVISWSTSSSVVHTSPHIHTHPPT